MSVHKNNQVVSGGFTVTLPFSPDACAIVVSADTPTDASASADGNGSTISVFTWRSWDLTTGSPGYRAEGFDLAVFC